MNCKCRLYGDKDETVNPISEFSKLNPEEKIVHFVVQAPDLVYICSQKRT